MSGPPPTPTALRRIRGNPGKRRLPQNEPTPDLVVSAEPPEDLPAGACVVWRRVAPQLLAVRLLDVLGREELAKACRLEAEGHRRFTAIEAGDLVLARPGAPDPLTAAIKCWEKASAIFARFGVAPADRARLHAPPPKRETKWATLVS